MKLIIDIPEEELGKDVINVCKGIQIPDNDEMLDNLGSDEFIVVCDCCGHIMRITRENRDADSD